MPSFCCSLGDLIPNFASYYLANCWRPSDDGTRCTANRRSRLRKLTHTQKMRISPRAATAVVTYFPPRMTNNPYLGLVRRSRI